MDKFIYETSAPVAVRRRLLLATGAESIYNVFKMDGRKNTIH